jgi:hypothetical protein
MMPESADPMQQSLTVIEIRPHRGGWQCFEGLGVGPYWIGDNAKQSALDYAKARAKFGHGEIRVLKQDGSIRFCCVAVGARNYQRLVLGSKLLCFYWARFWI